ncbi:TetR family transcriptional regulator [Acetobacterium tundrae]|uniref:TetR family transcriptional regulator n=2 Tax=Acetobacterium tundrae TaxID=132932 RepID=A0ABR6WK64_9FIRM|nr:TetR family transcriptional regulator [Acetobacterium tundrae]
MILLTTIVQNDILNICSIYHFGGIMARTKEQNEKMRVTRKEKIRNAALLQFVKQGLFATRIQDIAAEAGIAQGLLYHYYASKDEIFVDLINDALDKTIEASYSVRDMEIDPGEKIRFALERLIDTIENSQTFLDTCRLITQASNSTAIPQEARDLIQEKRNIPYQVIEKIMEAGQKEGTIIAGDPKMLSIFFWTNINGLAIYYSTNNNREVKLDYRVLSSMFLIENEREVEK